jgi:hypothetical protein
MERYIEVSIEDGVACYTPWYLQDCTFFKIIYTKQEPPKQEPQKEPLLMICDAEPYDGYVLK